MKDECKFQLFCTLVLVCGIQIGFDLEFKVRWESRMFPLCE